MHCECDQEATIEARWEQRKPEPLIRLLKNNTDDKNLYKPGMHTMKTHKTATRIKVKRGKNDSRARHRGTAAESLRRNHKTEIWDSKTRSMRFRSSNWRTGENSRPAYLDRKSFALGSNAWPTTGNDEVHEDGALERHSKMKTEWLIWCEETWRASTRSAQEMCRVNWKATREPWPVLRNCTYRRGIEKPWAATELKRHADLGRTTTKKISDFQEIKTSWERNPSRAHRRAQKDLAEKT
jgi:hypothetical protein